MPTLFLVGTPIGNLEDIGLRALRILAEVKLIAAEDTRKTGRLLKHYEIKTPLISYHEHSGSEKIGKIIYELETGDVALVSNAGMPGVSDPGYRLVTAAVEAGVRIEPIPGPTAAVSALVVSGLPTDRYLFLGFLPRQAGARQTSLREIAELPLTLVIYEAPHRLLRLIDDMLEILGDRKLCVARELTKLHEEIWRGTIREARSYFEEQSIRGEFTLVAAGAYPSSLRWAEDRVRNALRAKLVDGCSRKEAAAAISEISGWRKKELYTIATELEV